MHYEKNENDANILSNYKVGVLTVSDKGSLGEREDTSGPYLAAELKSKGYNVVYTNLISDDLDGIKKELIHCADELCLSLLLTTGGTGLSLRDNTPTATIEIVDKLAIGISEYMRSEGSKITPYASLSAGVSGVRGKTLIINLPGSLKAVKENLSFIIDPIIPHALKMINS